MSQKRSFKLGLVTEVLDIAIEFQNVVLGLRSYVVAYGGAQ